MFLNWKSSFITSMEGRITKRIFYEKTLKSRNPKLGWHLRAQHERLYDAMRTRL